MKYRAKHLKNVDEFASPAFKHDEPLLRYNACVPIYALTIVLSHKKIALVFKTFLELKSLIADFFSPLRLHLLSKYRVRIEVPTPGRLLWFRMRYLFYYRLGAMKVLQTQQRYRTLTFCKLILLARDAGV